MARRSSIRGTMLRARPLEEKAEAVRAFERELLPHLASGRLRPVIDTVVPYERAADAFARMAASGKRGKVLAALPVSDPLAASDARAHPPRGPRARRAPTAHALARAPLRRARAEAGTRSARTSADSRRMLEHALAELGVTAPARVLDVGTGTGQAAGILAELFPGAQIDAVDASPADDRAGACEARARARPLRRRRRRPPAVADATFDLTVSLLVHPFEHELHRVLAPGGWALFCYPMGPGTPIWFPSALVAPRLERAGFAEVRTGAIGPGEWTAGRR